RGGAAPAGRPGGADRGGGRCGRAVRPAPGLPVVAAGRRGVAGPGVRGEVVGPVLRGGVRAADGGVGLHGAPDGGCRALVGGRAGGGRRARGRPGAADGARGVRRVVVGVVRAPHV